MRYIYNYVQNFLTDQLPTGSLRNDVIFQRPRGKALVWGALGTLAFFILVLAKALLTVVF